MGRTAAALTAIDQEGGQVFVDGEFWKRRQPDAHCAGGSRRKSSEARDSP